MEITVQTDAEKRSFETESHVCAHRVAIRFWDIGVDLSGELEALLAEHGEDRALECIKEGYVEGELNYCFVDDRGNETELMGWWEIAR